MKSRASAADLCDVMFASVGFFGFSRSFESSANDLCSASDSMQAHLPVVGDEEKPLPPFEEIFGSTLQDRGIRFTKGMYQVPSFLRRKRKRTESWRSGASEGVLVQQNGTSEGVLVQQNGASEGVSVQQNGASEGVLVQQNGVSGGVLANASQASSGLSSCEVPFGSETSLDDEDPRKEFLLFEAQLRKCFEQDMEHVVVAQDGQSFSCRYCGHATSTTAGLFTHLRRSCGYRHRLHSRAPLLYQCPVCGEWVPDLFFGVAHLRAHLNFKIRKSRECFLCSKKGLILPEWVRHVYLDHSYSPPESGCSQKVV